MNNNNFRMTAVICTGTVAITLLVAIAAPHIGRKPTPVPDTRPVSAFTQGNKVISPPEPKPAPVGVEAANAAPNSTPPTEIDFEVQNPNDSTVVSTPKELPRDNPTPKPSSAPTPSKQAPVEPKMGDTRIVDGQKQVYFLGFGWIEDNDTANECTYAEDMYENGNKVGSMGDGDINKMVGTMGGGEVGRSCGDINKSVGRMD